MFVGTVHPGIFSCVQDLIVSVRHLFSLPAWSIMWNGSCIL